jgi:hypothetical protein
VARFLPVTDGRTIAAVGCGGFAPDESSVRRHVFPVPARAEPSRGSGARPAAVANLVREGPCMYARIQPEKVSCSISLALFSSSSVLPRSERGGGGSDPFQRPQPNPHHA